jgi:hypothetical protein
VRGSEIVDPAVGSGAFPGGRRNEMVRARSILALVSGEEKSIYDLKRETIENCLYGVDIDSSAVDIAKLRFWLSLIVDELDMKNIKPLPNLDHKIMCGNSLLEEFEGIKLFDERLLGETKKDIKAEEQQIKKRIKSFYLELGQINLGKRKDDGRSKEIKKEIKALEKRLKKLKEEPEDEPQQQTLSDVLNKRIKESQKKLSELRKLQKEFFNEQNRKRKKEQAEQINKLEWQLIEETLREQGKEEAIKKLEQYKKNKSKPFFLWKLHFSEVFQRKNPGFDVVIANPPYVRQEEIISDKKALQEGYAVFSPRSDLYTYFYERAIKLLKNEGTLVFISSNKFMRAKYGRKLREYLKSSTQLCRIVNFGSKHMFEAITNTAIILLRKGVSRNNVFLFSNDIRAKPKEYSQELLEADAWTLADTVTIGLKNKITKIGVPISKWAVKISYGIKTGYNDAFVLTEDEKNALLKNNKKSSEVIKPLLRGRDIKRYATKFANKWIIISKYRGHQDLIKNYPQVTEYLSKFEKKLKKRGQVKNGQHHWLELDNNPTEDYLNLFEQNKIIWIELTDLNKFTYSNNGEFILAGAFMMTGKNLKYLLSFLNSKLCLFYFDLICNSSGMDTKQWKKFVIDRLPVKKLRKKEQKPFIVLVDKILSITKSSDYLNNPKKQARVKKLEAEIDKLVYKIYGLTSEEIRIVEGSVGA